MGQIAKKVILGQAETKSYVAEITTNINDNGAKYLNLNYPISTGGARTDRIGQKIYLTSIRVRGQFYSNYLSSTTTKAFRVLLIKAAPSLGTSNGAISLTDVFRSGTTGVVHDAMVDTAKVKVFYDKTWTTTPTYGVTNAQTMLRPFEFVVPFGKSESFANSGNSELMDGSYFIIMCAYDGNNTFTPGGFNLAYSFNFKDE